MLSLLAVALLGQAQPVSIDGPIFNNPALLSRSPWLASFDYEWGTQSPKAQQPTLPTFAAWPQMKALCKVNAAGTAYDCYKDDVGTTLAGATWTHQNTATFDRTPWGLGVMRHLTDATAPYVRGISDLNGVFEGDFTLIGFGFRTRDDHADNHMLFEGYATNGGLWIRTDSNQLSCVFFEDGVHFPSPSTSGQSPPSITDGWGFFHARRVGGDHYCGINGNDGPVVSQTNTIVTAGAHTLAFGLNPDTPGVSSGGGHGWFGLFTGGIGIKEIDAIEGRAMGLLTRDDVSYGSSSAPWCMAGDDGGYECFSTSLIIPRANGFRGTQGNAVRNQWGPDPLDLSGDSDYGGTTTLTADVAPGPLFHKQELNTCDRMVALSGVGKIGANLNQFFGTRIAFGDTISAENFTAYVSAMNGDAGNVVDRIRLSLIVDGGFWIVDGGTRVDCDFATTSSPAWYECHANVQSPDGGATVQPVVTIGGTADGGSTTICYRGGSMSGWVPDPKPVSNGTQGNLYIAIDAGAFPNTHLGFKHETCFVPISNELLDWDNLTHTFYLHDAFDPLGNHLLTYLLGYQQAGHVIARYGNAAGGLSDVTADGISLSVGHLYCMSQEGTPGTTTTDGTVRLDDCTLLPGFDGGVDSCHATTVLGTFPGAAMPDSPTLVKICQRYDNTVPSDCNVLRFSDWTGAPH